MEPLICPQCGGQIKEYLTGHMTTICGYCGTRFLIEQNKEAAVSQTSEPVYEPIESTPANPQVFVSVLVGALVVFGIVGFVAIISTKKTPGTTARTVASTPYSFTPRPVSSPASTPNVNLLEFGGKGIGEGLFSDATSIAVDRTGRIYVADSTLRVQQFDQTGKYLKTIAIPAAGRNYSNARGIEKVRVASDGRLYVNVGGVILIYNDGSSTPNQTIHVAPDYIQDFALKSDGGMLMISEDDSRETLRFVNKAGRVTRSINAFHTKASNAALSPQETAIEAIRLGVDGAGNIFSIYAFGAVGSYEISYNAEELMIVRFSPDGQYVNKFVPTMTSCGIEMDNQGRIYLSDNNIINIYNHTGTLLDAVTGVNGIAAFALDKDNNVYVLADDQVTKRPAIK